MSYSKGKDKCRKYAVIYLSVCKVIISNGCIILVCLEELLIHSFLSVSTEPKVYDWDTQNLSDLYSDAILIRA